MLFDSHCHLSDAKFADDLDAVLARAWDAGLTGIVSIASNADDADAALAIATRDPRIHCTAGIHPHVAEHASDDQLERIRALVALPEVVAVGETGLDFHYDNSPRAEQLRSFEWHLALAAETAKPVIVHCRSADDDMIAILRAANGVHGVLHCFAGSRSLLDAALEAGWCVSFAGLVTFKNYDGADLVRAVPDDRLLVETDSPYLAPIPHRGRRNEPAFVTETARVIAGMRAVTPAALGEVTARNAARFYGLDLSSGA